MRNGLVDEDRDFSEKGKGKRENWHTVTPSGV
jgi:hypothetical protein